MSKKICASTLLMLMVVGHSQSVTANPSWLESGQKMLDGFIASEKTDQAPAASLGFSQDELIAGLKDALKVGSETVVAQLGKVDGFNADGMARIILPESLQRVGRMLDKAGMKGVMDDLEVRLNRAAEQAMPEAKTLLWQAIKDMSFEDAKRIYQGPDDAATQYLREKMSAPLGEALRPVVASHLADVGALQLYDRAIGRYKELPFVPDVRTDLTDHTVEGGMDALFYYLAHEEAAIRQDPLKRSTELLRKVFGS